MAISKIERADVVRPDWLDSVRSDLAAWLIGLAAKVHRKTAGAIARNTAVTQGWTPPA